MFAVRQVVIHRCHVVLESVRNSDFVLLACGAVEISSGNADKPFRSSGHNKSELAVSRWCPECRTSILARTEAPQIDATLREINENAVECR